MRRSNAITRYEVTAEHLDGRKWLVGYTPRVSRPGLLGVMRARGPVLIDKLGIGESDRLSWHTRPRVHALTGQWRIGYTGRTQIEAQGEGEHPFIGS